MADTAPIDDGATRFEITTYAAGVVDAGMGVLVGPGTDNVLPVGQTRGAVRYVDSPETPVLTDVFFIRIT